MVAFFRMVMGTESSSALAITFAFAAGPESSRDSSSVIGVAYSVGKKVTRSGDPCKASSRMNCLRSWPPGKLALRSVSIESHRRGRVYYITTCTPLKASRTSCTPPSMSMTLFSTS